eukprot:CAMPEP_0119313530 /NCGR_PEP_ID=MMETSP1333-20130426/29413_1 /TAXON_ID=418940 /ORGANISM="Scyphosphaera apsteinii, Strain RCC1455" /LENGTH=290 /DNA_ID=CAMNT_0007318387 /DNA_START=69 /DNA_END=941 /DNA_ORIENTATION=-
MATRLRLPTITCISQTAPAALCIARSNANLPLLDQLVPSLLNLSDDVLRSIMDACEDPERSFTVQRLACTCHSLKSVSIAWLQSVAMALCDKAADLDAFQGRTTIRWVGRGITPADCAVLAHQLLQTDVYSADRLGRIAYLGLGRNCIGDWGLCALSRAFAAGALRRCRALELYSNEINDIQPLTDAIAGGALPICQALYLNSNYLDDVSAQQLGDVLADTPLRGSLLTLWLQNNRITDLGVITFAAGIVATTVPLSLKYLRLDGNPITGEGRLDVSRASKEWAVKRVDI